MEYIFACFYTRSSHWTPHWHCTTNVICRAYNSRIGRN